MNLADKLQQNTKTIALEVIKTVEILPKTISSRAIANQLIRSGTSPGTNYRAARIAKSTADFISKMKIVEEELDETLYWLELLVDGNIIAGEVTYRLRCLTKETLAITIASIKTAKLNQAKN